MPRSYFLYAVLVALAASFVAPFLGLGLGGGLLASWTAFGWWRWAYNLAGSGKFVKVTPEVYRFDLWWRPLPPLLVPLTTVLVHDASGRWVLIDTGAADGWSQAFATQLVAALKKTLPKNTKLDAILLTHAHFDHAGGLPRVLQDHPDASVIMHEGEAPFLTGRRTYYPPNSPVVAFAQLIGVAPKEWPKIDPDKLLLLRGSSGGDLAAHGLRSLSWVATPGHSPGHVSFLHAPSSTLILGDALMNAWPSVSIEGGLGAALLGRPLRAFGRGGALVSGELGGRALRMLPRAVTDYIPVGLTDLLDSTLLGMGTHPSGPGAVAKDRTLSAATAVVGGAGDETSEGTVVKSDRLEGQKAKDVTVPFTWGLPRLAVRVKPFFLCPRPTGDESEGHRSICRLAGLQFKHAIPMHDATGRGLAREEVRGFAASLPACG